MKILVVEDDQTSKVYLRTLLCRYGDCDTASNGKEAVQAFRSALNDGRGYQLICMDIMMPEMDGQEALRQIRALETSVGVPARDAVKVIMTTALDDLDNVETALKGHCDAYLLKPIGKNKLVEHLRDFHFPV